jgi:hypothetical protein
MCRATRERSWRTPGSWNGAARRARSKTIRSARGCFCGRSCRKESSPPQTNRARSSGVNHKWCRPSGRPDHGGPKAWRRRGGPEGPHYLQFRSGRCPAKGLLNAANVAMCDGLCSPLTGHRPLLNFLNPRRPTQSSQNTPRIFSSAISAVSASIVVSPKRPTNRCETASAPHRHSHAAPSRSIPSSSPP